ncbi:MAG: hypothetical protein HKP61_05900 [Dactylosporangium sp.]|nr:hypothetical protein [Dactylosporangium sp.]NNJ60479.1 hypothetical protein [Dactylosporangium sp.]
MDRTRIHRLGTTLWVLLMCTALSAVGGASGLVSEIVPWTAMHAATGFLLLAAAGVHTFAHRSWLAAVLRSRGDRSRLAHPRHRSVLALGALLVACTVSGIAALVTGGAPVCSGVHALSGLGFFALAVRHGSLARARTRVAVR